MRHSILFWGLAGLLLSVSAMSEAQVVQSQNDDTGVRYMNSGVYSPGGQGTVGTDRYDLYTKIIPFGRPTTASTILEQYNPELAVDGITDCSNNNFYHSLENTEVNPWWQVNYADTATALKSMALFDRSGFQARLNNYTFAIYDADPTTGATPLWTSAINPTSNTLGKLFDLTGTPAGTWLRVTNNVGGTDNSILTLPEVILSTGETMNLTGYGYQSPYLPPCFVQSAGSTLQIDMGASGYDCLDVAGTFTAAGAININFIDAVNFGAGDYQVIKANSYRGSFASITTTNLAALDNKNLIMSTNTLNGTGMVTFIDAVHWKSSPANTNLADTNNWSGDPTGQTVYFGLYNTADEVMSNATLASDFSTGVLRMGEYVGSNGVITVNTGGSFNLTGTAWSTIANFGSAELNVSGGAMTVGSPFSISDQPGAAGVVNITSGTLTANNNFFLGTRSTGTINVSGTGKLVSSLNGNNTSTGFIIGYETGTANGILNITGGEVDTYGFQMGVNSGSKGTINISGGLITARSGNNWRVGNSGTGIVNQTGGIINADAPVFMADAGGSSGTLNLSGGTFNNIGTLSVGTRSGATVNISGTHEFNSPGQFIIAYGAQNGSKGTVNQSGGTVTITHENGVQYGSMNGGANGTYNLTGGVLTTPTMKISTTNVTAAFNLSESGQAIITGDLAVDTKMFGGTLQASSISSTVNQSYGQLIPGGAGNYGTTTITGTYNVIGTNNLSETIDPTTNIAQGKPASQASTYGNNEYPANNAVDGNTGNFAHTNASSGSNQWWQVQLGDAGTIRQVDSVKIYNRPGFERRIIGNGTGYYFELYDGTLDDLGMKTWTSDLFTTYEEGASILFDSPGVGNVLRLVRNFPAGSTVAGDELTLNLGEVMVYGSAVQPKIVLDVKADGTANDKIIVDGGRLNLSGGILELVFDDESAIPLDASYDLFELKNGGEITGSFAEIILPELVADATWNMDFQTGKLSASIPEPSTWAMLILGLAGVWYFRRKR